MRNTVECYSDMGLQFHCPKESVSKWKGRVTHRRTKACLCFHSLLYTELITEKPSLHWHKSRNRGCPVKELMQKKSESASEGSTLALIQCKKQNRAH